MRLIVTGAAGFIGSHFVEFLFSQPEISKEIEHVTIFDNLTYASNGEFLEVLLENPRVSFYQVDISNRRSLLKIDWEADVIVNFAAESHVDRSLSNPQIFTETNVLGTTNLLDFVLNERAKMLIQISTDEVYGSIDVGSWDEESHLAPRSPYSASKASADLLAHAYFTSFDIDVRITRASNNFGPRQHGEKMIPTIIRCIINNQPIPIYGSGNQVRDWMFVQDHVMGIWKCIKNGKKGQIYNLGGGYEITNLELVEEVSRFFPENKIVVEHIEDRKGHDFRYSLKYSKAAAELGYSPDTSWEEAMMKTIQFYRQK